MPEFPQAPRRADGTRLDEPPAGSPGRVGGGSPGSNPSMRLATLGVEFVLFVVVSGAIGYGIDRLRGGGATLFTLCGLGFGLLGGIIRFVRTALKAMKEQ